VRDQLEHLQMVLAERDEPYWSDTIGGVLLGTSAELEAFVVSDDLWGGSGSLADMVCMEQGRDGRRAVEAALIDLGEVQLREGLVNERTAAWVEAFREWRGSGI
jgi:hypothetical protein